MATSPNDPRITEALRRATEWMRQHVGRVDPDGVFVWNLVYPAGVGWAWCGGFQVAGFKIAAGVDLMKCAWWFYTPYIRNFAARIGALVSDPSPSGQTLFDWHGDGIIDHVGLTYPDYDSSLYRSIEGNTSSGTAGSQSNGGGVWIRYRHYDDIAAWVDMRRVLAWMLDNGKWDGRIPSGHNVGGGVPEVSVTNPNGYNAGYVREVQQRLVAHGYDIGPDGVDGVLGWDTYGAVSRFQADHGLDVDGVPGPLTIHKLRQAPGSAAQFRDIRALQRAVGATADNVAGPDTRKRLHAVRQASAWAGWSFPYGVAYTQSVVGTDPDGAWGDASAEAHDRAVEAIQQAVGATVDGIWGPDTEARVNAALAAAEQP